MRKRLFNLTVAVFKRVLTVLQPPDEVNDMNVSDDSVVVDSNMIPCPNCDNPALAGNNPKQVYFLCGSVIIINEKKEIDRFIAGEECLVLGNKVIDITKGIEH